MNIMHFAIGWTTPVLVFWIAVGCSQTSASGSVLPEDEVLTESGHLDKPLVSPAPEQIEAILHGDGRVSAETLLQITREETSALASVELLLSRLEECTQDMDSKVLFGEEGQPRWMDAYCRYRKIDFPRETKKYLILYRLADCIREATPSVERANARKGFFGALRPFFDANESRGVDFACRAVIRPAVRFGGFVRSETGWKQLLDLFTPYMFSEKFSSMSLQGWSRIYGEYCSQFPEQQEDILRSLDSRLAQPTATFLKGEPGCSFDHPTYCPEGLYRQLLRESPQQLAERYAKKDHRDASCEVIVALLTGTRQARLDSFKWAKPYLESLPKERRNRELEIKLLRGYAVPVAETDSQDETARQEWLINYLSSPSRVFLELLSRMVIYTSADNEIREPKKVPNPYGKERILQTLISYTASPDQFAAETAILKLGKLCWFDADSAAIVLAGLTNGSERLKTVSYPAGAYDPKPMLMDIMKSSIRSAKEAGVFYETLDAKVKADTAHSSATPIVGENR